MENSKVKEVLIPGKAGLHPRSQLSHIDVITWEPRSESYVTCAGNRMRREGTVNHEATWSGPRVVGGWKMGGARGKSQGQSDGRERKRII